MAKKPYNSKKRNQRSLLISHRRHLPTRRKAALDKADTMSTSASYSKRKQPSQQPQNGSRKSQRSNSASSPRSPSSPNPNSVSEYVSTSDYDKLKKKLDKINKEKEALITKLAQVQKDGDMKQKVIDDLMSNPKLSLKKKKEVQNMLKMDAKTDVQTIIKDNVKQFLIRNVIFTPNQKRLDEACKKVQEYIGDKSDPRIFSMTYGDFIKAALFQEKSDQISAGKKEAGSKYHIVLVLFMAILNITYLQF
jgi:tetrahydromethanopterin S-methyltransferase subunit G